MNETKPTDYTPLRIISTEEILKTIPHRYPFLLVDRVEIIKEHKTCVGIKCVSVNEPFFQGHFPGRPIMPGVLILEALAQTSAVLVMSLPALKGRLAYIAGIDGAKFRKLVTPGDTLKLFVDIVRFGGKIAKIKGIAFVGDEIAAQAEFVCVAE